jgi:histidinol-phosphate aminotransferase
MSQSIEIPWVRPELARPAPYRWQDNVPPGRPSRFDMNTLPRSPAYWPEVAARVAALESCSYPEATYRPLREALGRFVGFPPEQVVPGAGCDEILILCALLAVGRGDTAIVAKPTYQMYAVATQNAGGTLDALPPRDGLALDLDGVLERAPGARLVWLCSPNNPTGEEVPRDVVGELCTSCPGLVVVDQAYVELGGEDLSDLVHDHANLVVARTLSKGFALASLRVGYALASPAIAGALDGLRPPGSLSLQSATAAELGLGFADEMRADAAMYAAERGRLRRAFERTGLEVLGEAGSYVTLRVPMDSTAAFDALAAQGLVVRTFGHEPLLAGVVRASIATPPEDDRLVVALAQLAGRPAPAPEPAPAEHARLWGRRALVVRETRETQVRLRLVLDGGGRTAIATGVGFLDHMLHALAFHGMLDLDLSVKGDLEVDPHHTVEDCGIALGTALDRALGDRAGIRRFADARAPLDEALAEAVVDLSGRGGGGTVDLALSGQPVGGIPTTLFAHALDALARHARMTLHLRATGTDDHHVVEAAFKALALALRAAVAIDPARADATPSTKAVL